MPAQRRGSTKMAADRGTRESAGRLAEPCEVRSISTAKKKRSRTRTRAGQSSGAEHCLPTVVDLFCGAGGLSEGFRQAGFSILAGSDNDPDAMATYRQNFPEAAAITGDIRNPEVKSRVLDLAKRATVLIGGPPCRAFSQVRNHSRVIDDPRNALYREFVDVLRQTLPPAFVVENVTGMDQMAVREQIGPLLRMCVRWSCYSNEIASRHRFRLSPCSGRHMFKDLGRVSAFRSWLLGRNLGRKSASEICRSKRKSRIHAPGRLW